MPELHSTEIVVGMFIAGLGFGFIGGLVFATISRLWIDGYMRRDQQRKTKEVADGR